MPTKKINLKSVSTSFNRMVTMDLSDQVNYHQQKRDFADAILSNCPVLINFNRVKDTKVCNIILSFLQGVLYSIGGECYQITDESYLFGSEEAFKDGSLHKWIKMNGRI